MPKKENDGLWGKEYFALLWEYLKRNKSYERFCEWAAKQGGWGSLHPFKTLCIPEEFKGSQGFDQHPFFTLYNWWGDVRSKTLEKDFEHWWKKFVEEINRVYATVELYSETFEEDFDAALESLWSKHNKTRSIDELKERLERGNFEPCWNPCLGEYRQELKQELKRIIRSHPRRICLTVRIKRGASLNEIEKEVTRFLREEFHKARPNWNKYGFCFYSKEENVSDKGENHFVVTRLRKIELERYLEVYDLRNGGKKWPAILNKFYPRITGKLSNKNIPYEEGMKLLRKKDACERSLKRDYQKARKIITNLEQGNFPGKY